MEKGSLSNISWQRLEIITAGNSVMQEPTPLSISVPQVSVHLVTAYGTVDSDVLDREEAKVEALF